MIPEAFKGTALPLTQDDINNMAHTLGCEEALIHAFSDLESGGSSGFLSTGEPKILFEAHMFSKLTGGMYDDDYPNISSPVWDRSLYGAGGEHQYERLTQAQQLNSSAALESCSWGKYQVMGTNYHVCGYDTVEAMVEAFCADEMEHLNAFGQFCSTNHLIRYMTMDPPDFIHLAIGYNGAGEAANGYDAKLKEAFEHYVAQGEGQIPSGITPHTETHAPTPPTDDDKLACVSRLIAHNRDKITKAMTGLSAGGFAPPSGVLRSGSKGADVIWLQTMLRDWWLPITGVYDEATAEAVVYLEECEGITVDEGVAGPQVIRALTS